MGGGHMGTQDTFGIVGAGLAGAKAAEALRGEGFAGRILLLGEAVMRSFSRGDTAAVCGLISTLGSAQSSL